MLFRSLTLNVENAKHDYDVIIDSNNELEKCFANLKSENEALRIELEEKHKALEKNLNENAALKLTIDEKKKHTYHKHANRPPKKKHAHITCYECGRKGHITFHCSLKVKCSSFKKIRVPKGSHVLTNTQGPIKVWVPKSST